MRYIILVLLSFVVAGNSYAQEQSTSEEWRRDFVDVSFDKMVASHYTDDKGKRLTNDDIGRQTMGAVRHSKKQVLSNRVCSVRLSRNGRSFLELKCNGVAMTLSMVEQVVLEALDLVPQMNEEKLRAAIKEATLAVVEERKDDKEPNLAYNGGASKFFEVELKEMPGKIAFRVSMNELARKLPDADKWSTVMVNWAFVGNDEKAEEIFSR